MKKAIRYFGVYVLLLVFCAHARFFKPGAQVTLADGSERLLSFDIDFGGSKENPLAAIGWGTRPESGGEKIRLYIMLNESCDPLRWHGANNMVFGQDPFIASESGNKIDQISWCDMARIAFNHKDFTTPEGTSGNFMLFQGENVPAGTVNYTVDTNGVGTLLRCQRRGGDYNKSLYPVATIGTTPAYSFTAFATRALTRGLGHGYNLRTRFHNDEGFTLNDDCNWRSENNPGSGRKNIAEDLCGVMSYAGRAADTGALVWKQKIKNDGIFEKLEDLCNDEPEICEFELLSEDTARIDNPRGFSKGTIRVLDNVLGEWQNLLPANFFPFGDRDKRLPGTLLSSPFKLKGNDDRGPQVVVDNAVGSGLAVWARHDARDDTMSLKASYRLPIFGDVLSTKNKAFRWGPEFNLGPLVSEGERILFKVAAAPNNAGTVILVYVIFGKRSNNIYFHLFPLQDFFVANGDIPIEAQIPRLAFEDVGEVTSLDVAIDSGGHAVMLWTTQDSPLMNAAVFLVEEETWLTPEVISPDGIGIPILQPAPRTKMSLASDAMIVFKGFDANFAVNPVYYSAFNQVLPIKINNIDTRLIMHPFEEKTLDEDPTARPSCEQMLNLASAVRFERGVDRTASQAEYFNTVMWDAVSGAQNYLVERNGVPIATVAGDETTYIDHNKSPTIPYTYTVVAFNANGSPYCNKLTWDRMIGVTGYRIERLDRPGIIGEVDRETTMFIDCDSTQINDGSCDNCPSVSDCTYLVVGLRPESTPDCTVLTWEPVLDGSVSGYNIYRSAFANGPPLCCFLGSVNNPERFEFNDCGNRFFVPGCERSDQYTLTLIQGDSGCDRCNVISWVKPDTTLTIVGYNVYKNGTKLGSQDPNTPTVAGADTLEYVDCNLGTGIVPIRYFVVALIEYSDPMMQSSVRIETFPSNSKLSRPPCSIFAIQDCPDT